MSWFQHQTQLFHQASKARPLRPIYPTGHVAVAEGQRAHPGVWNGHAAPQQLIGDYSPRPIYPGVVGGCGCPALEMPYYQEGRPPYPAAPGGAVVPVAYGPQPTHAQYVPQQQFQPRRPFWGW